jgi:hypothetical protein
MEEFIKELINDLEKKQSEIYSDVEVLEGKEQYKEGFVKGYVRAFGLALLIVREDYNFYKGLEKYKKELRGGKNEK